MSVRWSAPRKRLDSSGLEAGGGEGSALSNCRRRARSLPRRGQEGGQIEDAHAAGEAGHHVGEVLDGIDFGEFAAAEERVGDGGALAAGVAAGKEEVLALLMRH